MFGFWILNFVHNIWTQLWIQLQPTASNANTVLWFNELIWAYELELELLRILCANNFEPVQSTNIKETVLLCNIYFFIPIIPLLTLSFFYAKSINTSQSLNFLLRGQLSVCHNRCIVKHACITLIFICKLFAFSCTMKIWSVLPCEISFSRGFSM